MKTSFLLIVVAVAQSLQAVEYRTLSKSAPAVTVAPSSLVEVVGASSGIGVEWKFANGDVALTPLRATDGQGITMQRFTNLAEVKIRYFSEGTEDDTAITLKITPAAEIGTAGPQTVLVIPENSEGDFDVVIESSGDLVTWAPMHSQTVSASGPKTFFRTRIVKR